MGHNISGPYNNQVCTIWAGALGTDIGVSTVWDNSVHVNSGDVGLGDGSVVQLSTAALRKQAADSDPVNANNHARVP